MRRGVPAKRIGGQLVTTVFDLLLRAVRRRARGAAGRLAGGLRRPAAVHPRLAAGAHRRRRATSRSGSRASSPATPRSRGPLDDRDGRRDQPLVPLRPDLPGDAQRWSCSAAARASTAAAGRTTSARRRSVRSPAWRRSRSRPTGRARRASRRHVVLVPRHRPVALRALPRRRAGLAARARACSRASTSPTASRRPRGWAGCPPTRPSTATRSTLADEAEAAGNDAAATMSSRSCEAGRLRFAAEDPDDPANFPRVLTRLAGEPARLLEQGPRVLPAPPARRHEDAVRAAETPPRAAPAGCRLARGGAEGQARPAHHDRLPHERLRALLGRRAAGGDLVREVRHLQHRPAPVRALLQRGDPAAVGGAHATGTCSRASPSRSPRLARPAPRRATGPRRRAAAARHAGRARPARRRRARLEAPASASRSPGETMPQLIVVERDYAAVHDKMTRARPAASRQLGIASKGVALEARRGGRRAGRASTASSAAASPTGGPALSRAEHACRDDPRAVGHDQRPARASRASGRWRRAPAHGWPTLPRSARTSRITLRGRAGRSRAR